MLESSTQTVTLEAGATQTVPMYDIFSGWADLVSGKTVVSCLLVPTGSGTGAYFDYHFQGVSNRLDQNAYGVSITNKSTSTQYTWTYKIVLALV